MTSLGTLQLDFLVRLGNSISQVERLENRVDELEDTSRDAKKSIEGLARGFDDATGSFDRIRKSLGDVVSGNGGMGDLIDSFKAVPPQAMIAAAGVAAVTGAIALMGKAASDALAFTQSYGDEMAKSAQKAGVSVTAYQELRHAADMSGVSAEELGSAFKNINKALGDSENPSNKAVEQFNQLGISLKDSSGKLKSADQLLVEAAGAFEGISSSTERAALAQKLFGDEGVKLLPLLNSGEEGIKAMREEANELGIVMSDDATKAAEAYGDSMSRLSKLVDGMKISLGTALMPAAQLVVDVFVELGKAFKGVLPEGSSFKDLATSMARGALRLVIDGVQAAAARIKALGQLMVAASPIIGQVVNNFINMYQATRALINILDVFRGIIQGAVLFALGELVRYTSEFLGLIGRAASVVPGMENISAKFNEMAAGGKAAAASFREVSRTSFAGAATDLGDAVDAFASMRFNAFETGKEVAKMGQALEKAGNIDLSGVRGVLEGSGGQIVISADERDREVAEKNTKAVEENTKELKHGRGAGGAAAAKMTKFDPVSQWESLTGKKLAPGMLKSPEEAAAAAAKAVEGMAGTQAELKDAYDRQLHIEMNTLKANEEINRIATESAGKIAAIQKQSQGLKAQANKLDTDYNSILAEKNYRQNALKDTEAKQQKNQNELQVLEEKQKALKLQELRNRSVFNEILREAPAALKLLLDTNISERYDQAIKKAEELETKAKGIASSQAEIKNKRAEYNRQLEEGAMLQAEHAQRVAELDKNEAELIKKKAALNRNIAAQEAAIQRIKDEEAAAIAAAKQRLDANKLAATAEADSMMLKMRLLQIENELIVERSDAKRDELELERADINFQIASNEIQRQGLTGLQARIALQQAGNELIQEEVAIGERKAQRENEAAEKANSLLAAARATTEDLVKRNEIATRELEILNEKDELEKLSLEYALEKNKINASNLTALEKELELAKLRNQYEEKITAERVKQAESLGKGFQDVGNIFGTLGGISEKLGIGEAANELDMLSGSLAGVGSAAMGVGRVMAGDVLGGVAGIVGGVAGLFESIYDYFNEEQEQMKPFGSEVDINRVRTEAQEFARAFADEQERRQGRPVVINVDARGAMVGDENEVARAIGNLLENEMGRRIGNVNIPRRF